MKNKKSNATYILVLVLITLLSFFVYMNFFVDISSSAVSTADDVSCRTYLAMKDFPGMKLASFFYVIKGKCMVDDDVKINLENREESFETIAHQMSRCWYRYGEGEFDFLGNFDTTGNWCFLCGGIEMNIDDVNSFMFTEFVKWTNETKFNDSLTYYEYIGIKYSDVDDNVIEEIRKEYLEIIKDKEGDTEEMYREIVMTLGNQINYLEELKNKQIISSDEKVYVVYRYDRVDKDFMNKLENALIAGIGTAIGSMIVSSAVESVTLALFTKGTGIVAFPFLMATKAIKAKNILEKLERVFTLLSRTSTYFKNTRKTRILASGAAGGAAGGYIGYNYNSNYEQYVDLLTREEYYKYCGTEGGNFK